MACAGCIGEAENIVRVQVKRIWGTEVRQQGSSEIRLFLQSKNVEISSADCCMPHKRFSDAKPTPSGRSRSGKSIGKSPADDEPLTLGRTSVRSGRQTFCRYSLPATDIARRIF